MFNLKRFFVVFIIILLVNPISFAQVIVAEGILADESFIEIENSEELANIKEDLTGDYILTQDIDLKDAEWEPIQGKFTGTLTGDDFIIQNMPAQYLEDENLGLFTEVEDLDNIDIEIEFIEEIESSEELANIKDDLTGNYILTKNIDLKDAEWEPIDKGEFTGTLTGDDFIIQNMPAQYLEDENYGLFTEVEDISNIDVKVKFIEEEKEESETEEEAVEEKTEEAETEEEAEEPKAEEEVVEKEQEVNERKMSPMAEGKSKDVWTWGDLSRELGDSSVTEINFQDNISRGSGTINFVVPRDGIEPIVINGNGYQLSGGRTNEMLRMQGNGQGIASDITFKDIKLKPTSGQPLLGQRNSVGEDFTVTFKDIIDNKDAANTKGGLVDAKNAHVIFKGINNYQTNGTPTIINDAKSFIVEETPKVSIPIPGKIPDGTVFHTKGKVYHTKATGAVIHVKSSGVMILKGSDGNNSAIELEGEKSKILVEGQFMLGSDRTPTGITGGLIKLTGESSEFNVRGGATVGFSQLEGSILYMESDNSKVNISGEGTNVQFALKSGDGSHDAAIHFNRASNYELNVTDHALFEVVKESGQAMGIRVGQGTGHKVNITDGSKFKIHNKGNGVAADPQGEEGRNQALYYNGTLPEFNLTGKGSEVELIADSGIAMHMTGGGIINVNEGTTMIARGKTKSANRGIIDTGGVEDKAKSIITMTNPAFYDFRNENTEGFVFHVGLSAEIIGNRTDMAMWERGKNVNLDGPHTRRFADIVQYRYIQADFTSYLSMGSTSTELKELHSKGGSDGPRGPYPNGLKEFARVSGNNAQAVVNDLYIPTNADQKIYAQVSVDEGIFGKRDVYTNEVEVDIKHTKKDGPSQIFKGKTIGKDQYPDQEAYEIYGKMVDPEIGAFGWVEIELPHGAYLETGDTLEVDGARIQASNHTTIVSDPENLFSEIRTVVDVSPPEPAVVEAELMDHPSRPQVIEGELLEDGVEVSVEVNGQAADGEVNYPPEKDRFTYTFNQKLKIGDKVQIFLNDMVGSAEGLGSGADRPNRPKTNLDSGNINPEETYRYHDKDFVKGTIIGVVESTGELVFESAPAKLNFKVKNKSYTDEYLVELAELGEGLVISDNRPDKTDWHLTAKMEKQLTAESGEELKDALVYRDNSTDIEINNLDSVVKSYSYEENPPGEEEIINLSSGWSKEGNGVFIEIEPGTKKTDYDGKVKWTLHDTP